MDMRDYIGHDRHSQDGKVMIPPIGGFIRGLSGPWNAMLQKATATLSTPATAGTAVQAPRIKLLYKLLGIFLGLAIVPVMLAGYFLVQVPNNYIQAESRGVKMAIAQKVASNVVSYIDNVKIILQVVHKSSDFLTMNSGRQKAILSNVMNAYPMFMRMAVVDLNGREIAAVNRVAENPTRERWERVEALKSMKALGDYISDVSRSQEMYPRMTIGVPIERIPGRPVGMLLGVVNLIDLSSIIKDLSIGKKGYVYIVDMKKKQLIAHPDVELLLNAEAPKSVAAAFLSPEDTDSGAYEFVDDNKNKFLDTYATVPIRRLNWRVFVQQPTAEAYETASRMRSQIRGLLLFVALITLALAYFISRSIVQRVSTLQSAMEQVGEGNFDVPSVPAYNDEFGSLTQKFIWMAHSLKDKTLRLLLAQHELQRWNSQLEQRVTERTRALREAQEQLIAQEKLAALGQMASVVGHELRNPLAVMNNSVYFLKTKIASLLGGAALEPKLEKHLNVIESEIGKSNNIIRDVLDFARNRALNPSLQKVDEMVEKAIERIQVPEGVTLLKQLSLNGTQAMVDEDELRQVLVNLMENACQAMTSGGTLTVGTKAQGERVAIDISDTGCGIPQEHLSKIFAPFFTTKSRGTGLGLAVVKKIVERHQGSITVESKVGEGTSFHIQLPITQASAGAKGK
jgi:signal transduction histidine kinase